MELKNRVVVVTGASSGIGKAAVEAFVARGATVMAVARRQERLDEVARDTAGVVPVQADLTDEDDRRRVVATAGQVDVLVNNAGVGWWGLFEQMPLEEVRRLYETNVLAAIDLTRMVLPGMLERKRGHIVNVSSQNAFVAAPPLSVYASTKFALQGFTQGLRREVGGRGVGVSSINPGPIRTEFAEAAPGGEEVDLPSKFNAIALPPSLVANAIVRAVEREHLPGYAEVSVPRVLGVSRIAGLPGLNRLVDLTTLPARSLAARLQGQGNAATVDQQPSGVA